MSQTTVLVIDDSATIRRLVDSHLSQAGYRVVLAGGADDGLRLAHEVRPDLILLDHQLPGTTGYQVCQSLLESEELRQVPVVVSSTLRNRAYAEYTDLPNVVDMLPKPYTEQLLEMTVANALDTGSLVVASQTEGTAVPEVIEGADEVDLSGSLAAFRLREVLDFLNNAGKCGVLEVETEQQRVWFYLAKGRIQAVAATGIDPRRVSASLPDPLRELAPVLHLTVGGRSCAEIDGLVELLDNKVLDPRLLRQLLRHQAAVLARNCFLSRAKLFRFESDRPVPPLFRRLPLEISLAALLVEGALRADETELPEEPPESVFVRRSIRGQNLDRTGLSARHMKALGELANPSSSRELAERLGWDLSEVRRVLHGLTLAELVEVQQRDEVRGIVILETDPELAQQLREEFARGVRGYTGKVVRDRLAMQLVLKRSRPDALVIGLNDDRSRQLAEELLRACSSKLTETKWIAAVGDNADLTRDELRQWHERLPRQFDGFIRQPYDAEEVVAKLQGGVTKAAENEELAPTVGGTV